MAENSKKQKAVIITGGAKRLGFEFAKKSLAMGYAVVIQYRSTKKESEEWLSTHPEYRHCTHFVHHELQECTDSFWKKIERLPLTVTGLVNNASVFHEGDITDLDNFHTTLTINSLVPLALGVRLYRSGQQGWIINITDARISRPNKRYQNYRIAKQLLTDLTSQMAFRFAPRVRVNAIAPGAMLPSDDDTERFESLAQQVPMGRVGALDSLARTFEFLVTDSYITGEVICIDGGWHLT
jgi:NAD(P)-dependent dehydrogenase (short-subunit alcohol dehydrogenase family)